MMIKSKKIVTNLFKLGVALKKAQEDDGKINWLDIPELAGPSIGFVTSLSDLDSVKKEWQESSQESRDELCKQIKTEFDLQDDALEEKIEAGIEAAFALANFALLPGKSVG